MTSDDSEVTRVRRLLGEARGPRGQRLYSPEARAAAARLAQTRQQRDVALAATARALAVHPITLAGWVRAAARAATSFVAVVTPPAATRPPGDVSAGIVVHGAGGLRIEGLTVAQLAELLRRVG